MAAIVCERCGAEIPPGAGGCLVCRSRRRRPGSPQVWLPPRGRRVALVAGILIALLILAMLVWRIADSRRRPLEPVAPVLLVGAVEPAEENPSPAGGEGWRTAAG